MTNLSVEIIDTDKNNKIVNLEKLTKKDAKMLHWECKRLMHELNAIKCGVN